MKAIIMAGGEGKRLKPVTGDTPKPLAQLCGRPVMEHIILLLKRHGIRDICAALKYRSVAERVMELMGRRARVIHVVGGGTKDRFLSQLTADACGIPVCAGPEEATAIGNLMMQLMAAGEVSDLGQARRVVAASFETKQYLPTADRNMWDEAYGRIRTLYR